MSVVQSKVIKSEKMEYLSCYWTNKGRFGLFEISMKRLFKLKTFQSIKNPVKRIWVCTHSLSLSVSPGKCMGHITGQAASFPPCSRPTCTEFFFYWLSLFLVYGSITYFVNKHSEFHTRGGKVGKEVLQRSSTVGMNERNQ